MEAKIGGGVGGDGAGNITTVLKENKNCQTGFHYSENISFILKTEL